MPTGSQSPWTTSQRTAAPPRGGAHPLPDRLRLTLYLPLPPLDLHTAFLRQAVERLKVEEGAGARFHHPDHQFADQIGDLDGVC